MNTQLDLTTWQPAPTNGTETSDAAARDIEPSRDTLRWKVLDTLRDSDGLTDEEIQARVCMPGSTERPRRQELERLGLVFKTDRKRMTRSGRKAAVWMAR